MIILKANLIKKITKKLLINFLCSKLNETFKLSKTFKLNKFSMLNKYPNKVFEIKIFYE